MVVGSIVEGYGKYFGGYHSRELSDFKVVMFQSLGVMKFIID
jgi:hypothetical protein